MTDALDKMRNAVTAALTKKKRPRIPARDIVLPTDEFEDALAELQLCQPAKKNTTARRGHRVVREIADVEAKLVKHVEGLDGLCEKFTKRRGSPDRLVIEGRGWERAAQLLHDIIKEDDRRPPDQRTLSTHLGRKDAVRAIVAQMIYFVECKAPGKKPRKKQRADHARRRKLGMSVLVYDGEWHD